MSANIQIKSLLPASLAQLPSYSKLIVGNTNNESQAGNLETITSLVQRQVALNDSILQARKLINGGLPSNELIHLLSEHNYGDCRHIATVVNAVIRENTTELGEQMPSGIVVLMDRKNYYALKANIVLAPLVYGSRLSKMDEGTHQSFRKGCSVMASPKHVFNVLNMPKDLQKKLDKKGVVFLSPDFKELGDTSVVIDPWLTDEIAFLSSETDSRYKESFGYSHPIVMLLKPDQPISSICLW